MESCSLPFERVFISEEFYMTMFVMVVAADKSEAGNGKDVVSKVALPHYDSILKLNQCNGT